MTQIPGTRRPSPLDNLYALLGFVLEWMTIILMVSLTIVVIVAVVFRMLGDSLSWYDEVAAIQLAWVTYYGAALAALRRRHIGFDSVLLSLPLRARLLAVAIAEVLVIGFFVLLAYTGMLVLDVLEGERLVSLTWVPVRFTQSVIPLGAVLFIVAELVSLPGYWRTVAAGISLDHPEIQADDKG